jgi:ABC-type oligopeptide transport system substrate-binding subunit
MHPQSYGTAVRSGKFDLALVRWGAEYPDASDFLVSQLQTGAPNNLSRWSNYHFDGLVKAATMARVNSPERRRDLLGAAQIATKYVILMPLDSPVQVAVISGDVKGLQFTPMGLSGWDRVSRQGSLGSGY